MEAKQAKGSNKIGASSTLELSAETVGQYKCAQCHEPMTKVLAGKHPAMVCMAHRIVTPLSDADYAEAVGLK